MDQRRRERIAPVVDDPSLYVDLDNAICLLALLTRRPPDIEEILPQRPKDASEERPVEQGQSEVHDAETLLAESDADVDEADELDNSQAIDADPENQQSLIQLKNKVLDRLAETLARFKSEPGTTSVDAKHVASTMMITYESEERVKILCSKNEGLDKMDKSFLRQWTCCMQTMAKQG